VVKIRLDPFWIRWP